MPYPVFSHIMGTIALIGIALAVVGIFHFLGSYAALSSAQVQLREVVEAVGRNVVELASIYTLTLESSQAGSVGVTCMKVNLPSTVGGMPYSLTIGVNGSKLIVLGEFQHLSYYRIITLPYSGAIGTLDAGVYQCGDKSLEVSRKLLMPLRQQRQVYLVAQFVAGQLKFGFGEG